MIGILTYNVPHRKTYDTLCLLKASGYSDVVVFAKRFHYKKSFTPLFQHRPAASNNIEPHVICKNFGFTYVEDFNTQYLSPGDKILVCGAGIIEPEYIETYQLINSHPGLLPKVRGLDALKWAIYEGLPIGVTTHRLSSEIDAGLLIEQKTLPVYHNDTFHAVALRQYEMEISMLVEAIEKIDSATVIIGGEGYPVRRRMPHTHEMRLMERFGQLKRSVPID